MKKETIIFAWLLAGLTMLTMGSCLSNDHDDDNQITPEQAKAYMRSTDGEYYGHIRFYNDTVTSNTSKIDSVSCYAVMRSADSTIQVRNVSPRIFSKLLTGERNKELREAIDQLPEQTLTMRHAFFDIAESGLIVFGVYPLSTTLNVEVNGETTQLEFNYYVYWNANGKYYKNETSFNFFVQEIKINGSSKEIFTISNNYVDENCTFNLYAKRLLML